MIGDLLNWLRVSVLPSLALLEKIGKERGYDIYDLLRKAKKRKTFSKKQNRLYLNSKSLPNEVLDRYLMEFLGGDDDSTNVSP